jgi:hypothetical protein
MGMHRFDTDDSMLNTEVNSNTNLIDTIPPTVCTSSSRPVSDLYSGRLIWETDTRKLMMYDAASTSWKFIGSPDLETATALNAGWTAYTCTWTGATTNPVIGNGTFVSEFMQIGKTVWYKIHIVIGSTTTVGSGSYTWSLPVAPVEGLGTAPGTAVVSNGGSGYARTPFCVGGPSIVLVDASAARVAPTVPFALATGHIIHITGCYEVS